MAASPTHFERISWAVLAESKAVNSSKVPRRSTSAAPRERVSKWWCADPGPSNLQCRTPRFSHHEFISHSKSSIHLPHPFSAITHAVKLAISRPPSLY